MIRHLLSKAAFVLTAVATALSSCATPPPPRPVSVSERVQFDRAIGTELAQQMDPKLTLKKDAAVQSYLTRISQRLADKTPDLHLPETRVLLVVQDRKWSSYALPGGRLYISAGLLKNLGFENEVAAVLAIQLGHLLKEHVLEYLRRNPSGLTTREVVTVQGMLPLKTLQAPEDLNFFGKEGVFSFRDAEELDAIEAAVDILYAGGYDPRGIVSMFKYFKDDLSHSPYDPDELDRFVERARRRIALQAPLRNPIVRTDEFLLIRKKIEKL